MTKGLTKREAFYKIKIRIFHIKINIFFFLESGYNITYEYRIGGSRYERALK